MDEKTLQALTALAEKLGTTAEYLWGVLLNQAPISGVTDFAVMLAWCVAIVIWTRIVHKKTAKPTKQEGSQYIKAEWSDEFGVFSSWVSVFILWFVFAIIAGESMSMVIAAIFNPEYWALKQILK